MTRPVSLAETGCFVCAPDMVRSATDGAVNWKAKADREVTWGCKSPGGSGDGNPYDVYGFDWVASPSETPEEYRAVMEETLGVLQESLPSATVFLVGFSTPLKEYVDKAGPSWLLSEFTQDSLEEAFKEYNAVLKEVAQESNCTCIDIPAQWPSDREERWELLADGVHPSDDGYDHMASLIYDTLRATVIHSATVIAPSAWGMLKLEAIH